MLVTKALPILQCRQSRLGHFRETGHRGTGRNTLSPRVRHSRGEEKGNHARERLLVAEAAA